MTSLSAEKARTEFAAMLNRAEYAHEPTIITKHGKEVAALVPLDVFRAYEAFLARLEDAYDAKAAREALQEMDKGGGIPWDEVKAELGL